MPSQALIKFENNLLVEVDRLLETHKQLNHIGRGRRGLGHITRSGVLMLCAAWELYIEEVLADGVKCLCDRCVIPDQLPLRVRKELAKSVKESKHELKPLELSGDGWKLVHENNLQNTLQGLNSPKSTVINPLFQRFLGVEKLSDSWSLSTFAIDAFVKARGDIAHRGRDTKYITIVQLRRYREEIVLTVVETDNFLADYLQITCPDGRSPWRRRNAE